MSDYGICLSPRGAACIPLGQIPVMPYGGPPGSSRGTGGGGGGIQSLDLDQKDIVNTAGTGVPITTTGRLALKATGVAAGTYATPVNLVVDAKGRISSVASSAGFVERVGGTLDSQIAVWHNANANTIRAVPVTISAAGNVAGVADLTATGTIDANVLTAVASISAGTVFRSGDGSAASVAFGFTGAAGTGTFRSGGGDLAFSVAGTHLWNIDATALFPQTDNAVDFGKPAQRIKDIYLSGASLNMHNALAADPAVYSQNAAGDALLSIGATTAWTSSASGAFTTAAGITATTGNIAASAGALSASTSVTAGTGVTATTGNIAASAGNVTASGLVSAGTSVSAGTTVTAGTGLTVSSGVATVPVGTVGAPSINFGTANTGFYQTGTGEVACSIAGTQRARVTAAGLAVTGICSAGTFSGSSSFIGGVFAAADGSTADAGFQFALEPGTGLYRPGGGILGITAGGFETARVYRTAGGWGVLRATGETTSDGGQLELYGAGNVYAQLSGDPQTPPGGQLLIRTANSGGALANAIIVNRDQNAIFTQQLQAPVGTAAAPAYSFTGATGYGLLQSGTTIQWSAAGATRMTLTNAGNLGIGTTPAAAYRLHIWDSSASTVGKRIAIENAVGGTTNVNRYFGDLVFLSAGDGSATIGESWQLGQDLLAVGTRLFQIRDIKAGGAPVRLSITTTGVVQPGANGTQDFGATGLQWRDMYASGLSRIKLLSCALRRSTQQLIPNNTFTSVIFNETDLYDPTGMHDPAVNNTRITIQEAGVYRISASGRWADTTAGTFRGGRIFLNALTDIANVFVTKDGTGRAYLNAWVVQSFIVGDFLTFDVIQDSGGDLNFGISSGNVVPRSYFMAEFIA